MINVGSEIESIVDTVPSPGSQGRRGDQALSCFADVEILHPSGVFCARQLPVFARVASEDLR